MYNLSSYKGQISNRGECIQALPDNEQQVKLRTEARLGPKSFVAFRPLGGRTSVAAFGIRGSFQKRSEPDAKETV